MLDIKFIIENKDQVQDGLNKKGYAKIINLDELISLHGSINKLKTSSQALAEEKTSSAILSNQLWRKNARQLLPKVKLWARN